MTTENTQKNRDGDTKERLTKRHALTDRMTEERTDVRR